MSKTSGESQEQKHYSGAPEWWMNALIDPRDVYPPTGDEIISQLMTTGDLLTSDFQRLQYRLDRIAPVRASLAITRTPPGFAPEQVRREWVGITLPLRGYFDPDEGYRVHAREALEALKLKSPEAHDWWRKYYVHEAEERLPQVESEGFPEFLANMSFLVFDLNCGDGRLNYSGPIAPQTIPISEFLSEHS